MGTVDGTSGNDVIDTAYLGDDDNDRIDANDAVLVGTQGDEDVVAGYGGDDVINAGAANDTVFGGDGNDVIDGGAGADVLFGGAGADRFVVGAGDRVDGGSDGEDMDVLDLRGVGDYRIEAFRAEGDANGFSGTVFLLDDAGAVTGTIAFAEIEALMTDAGETPLMLDGIVEGTVGDDIIDAGYDDDPEGDRVDAGDAIAAGAAPDDDRIEAYGGDDRVFAGLGDDDVFGGAGADTLFGGIGNDVVSGDDGADAVFGGAGEDRLFGGAGRDIVDGGAGADDLSGGAGNDILFGGTGGDTLRGGEGADVLSGGADADLFIGGSAGDVVDGGSDGDDFDTLDLTGSGVDFISYTSDDREDGIVTFLDGSTMSFAEVENVVPCFTPGTTIATPRGERLVEELRAGDRIITRDNGIQEIRWTGRKDMTGVDLRLAPHLRPVMVRAGALGAGLPERDMLVSPNHRFLVGSDRTQLYFDETEVLAAAKHLVGAQGIMALDMMRVSYIHFMFDRHEVVLSNGSWTESFQPGDFSLKGIGNAQRGEIIELFPELETQAGLEGYVAARKSLKKHEARLLHV